MDVLDLNEDAFPRLQSFSQPETNKTNKNEKWNDKVGINKMESDLKIRSSAVVTYSTAKYPALFSQLAPSTNLNLAPSNWLRRAPGLRPNTLLSGGRQAPSCDRDKTSFSSFRIANNHLNVMGEVDVVSDAENIKKLLKVPYSKAHISMAVHRAGKTLLLEQFDVSNNKNMESGRSVRWFQDVYEKATCHGSLISSKKKLPSAQLDRLMLSKFLYYSIKGRQDDGDQDIEDSNLTLEDLICLNPDSQSSSKIVEESMLVPQELRWKYWTPSDDMPTPQPKTNEESFEKTILWTFEDLQMLLGTNMPVFGEGKYPAVSLRLRDSNKPINVLTGIDYWLDNLICNVPELHMCFHLDGFVQNYEVIKTEEIPKLQDSKFSPKVIKDIAQNILSFLKSNCTKEGHTYWLFKGDNDDVVKLYDLTTLCTNTSENKEENPFTFSVATLIYKMAVNLMQNPSNIRDHEVTIKKLLQNCVELLEKNFQLSPVMLAATLCMLSSLCLPDSNLNENNEDKKTDGRIRTNSVNFMNSPDRRSDNNVSMEVAVIPSVSDLSIPEKYSLDPPSGENGKLKDGCYATLNYIVKGLKVFRDCAKYKINEDWMNTSNDILVVNIQLIRNTVLVYYNLASRASQEGKFGRALRCLNIALHGYEHLEHLYNLKLPERKENENIANDLLRIQSFPDFQLLLPRLLILCGDIQLIQTQQPKLFPQQFHSLSYEDVEISETLSGNQILEGNKYRKLAKLSTNNEEVLTTCMKCFEMALKLIKSQDFAEVKIKDNKKKNNKKDLNAKNDLTCMVERKLGHVANEQGALQLNKAFEMLNDVTDNQQDLANKLNKEKEIWKESFSHLETALTSFTHVNDFVNQALVLSNLGRLMRICAQSIAQSEKGDFTRHEQQIYDKAIDYYQKALQIQQNLKSHRSNIDETEPSVYDNISWELSGAYFTMAQRLQDHAPVNLRSPEQIEKEISDLMNKSLKNCVEIWKNTVKRSLAVFRCAKIHHRLASLHHNAYRQLAEGKKRQQIRSLAMTHYKKSSIYFTQLNDEHPADLLRVQLELLALKEQHAGDVNSPSNKLKILKEAIDGMVHCSQPLLSIQTCIKKHLSLNLNDKGQSTSVDPVIPDLTLIDLEDWISLVKILAAILRSLLLSVLKITAPVSGVTQQSSSSGSKKKSQVAVFASNHIKYKDLYSFMLRTLQNNEQIINSKIITDEKLKLFLYKVEAIISVFEYIKDKVV